MTMAGTEAKSMDVDMDKTAGMPTAGMTMAGAAAAVMGTDTIATNRHHNGKHNIRLLCNTGAGFAFGRASAIVA